MRGVVTGPHPPLLAGPQRTRVRGTGWRFGRGSSHRNTVGVWSPHRVAGLGPVGKTKPDRAAGTTLTQASPVPVVQY